VKNLLVFTLLFLFTSSLTFGQKTDYSVDWGPSYKKEGGLFSSNQLIGLYGKNYYTLSKTRKSTTLLKFDMNHKLVSNKPISKKYEGDKISFSKFLDTKNGTFAYMPQMTKGEWKILVSKFDGNDFGKIKEVFKHDFKVKRIAIGYGGLNSDATNKLVVSMDEKKVAYTNIISMKEKKNDEETMVIALFNADMELQWDKRQNFGYKDKGIKIKQTVVDQDGVVYILAAISDKAKKLGGQGKSKNKVSKGVKNDDDKVGGKSKNLPRYHYSIFRITKDDMKEFKIDIKDDNLAPVDIAMYFPDKGTSEMIVSGFYTDTERRSGIKGLFYASGNSKGGISTVKINEFDADFLDDFATEKDIKKDRGLNMNYNIDDFIHFSDGSIGFIAEQYYVTTHTYTDSQGRRQTTYHYHSNNILIPRFSADGKLLNTQKIKKNFTSSSSIITSYSIAVANDKIYLIFNDFKSRDERKDMADKKGKKGKRKWRYTDLVVLSTDGDILYNETLFNSNEIDLTFIPSMCEYSSDVIILGSLGRKEYAFGTIKIK
jgi:hypothetical protein